MSRKPFSIEYLIGDTVTSNRNNSNDSDIQRVLSKPSKLLLSMSGATFRKQGKSCSSGSVSKKATTALKDYHPALRNVSMRLEGASLWNKFHAYGTEMIVTKTGR